MTNKSKKKGKRFEQKVIKSINSGALWFNPLDMETKDYAIECKITDKKGFRISSKLLDKIWGQALAINKLPLLVIGIPRNNNELFILNCNISLKGK